MPWTPDFLEDGEAAIASVFNQKFSSAATWLGGIGRAGLRRGAFNHRQAGSLLTPDGTGYTTYGDHGTHVYTRAVFGASIQYSAYGGDDGTDTGANIGTGDRIIIGHPSATGVYSGPTARLDFNGSGIYVGSANDSAVSDILLLLNLEIVSDTGATTLVNLPAAPPNFAYPAYPGVMVCFQYRLNGAGTWYTIHKSERFSSVKDRGGGAGSTPFDLDVPLASCLTEGIISNDGGNPATDRVTSVRAMFSIAGASGAGDGVTLNRWNFTAIPILAQDNG